MKNRIDIKYYGFIYILILMLTGSISMINTYVSFAISAIIAVIIGISGTKDINVSIPKGLVTLLLFQNLCIGIGAHMFGNTNENLKFVTQIPFLTIGIIFIVLLYSKKINNRKDQKIFFCLLCTCIVLSFFIGRGSLQAILINLRNMLTFYFAYSIGRASLKSKDQLDSFIKYIHFLSIIILIFGIILLVGGYKFYKVIGIKEVYIAKGSPIIGERLDSRFKTTILVNQYTRMGSILYEPVNLAYFYSLCVLIAIYYRYQNQIKSKIIYKITSIIGLILTFGKGGYLITLSIILLTTLTKLIYSINKKISIHKAMKLSGVIGVALIIIFCVYYYTNIGGAANPHFWGILKTWQSILNKPIGYGLGTGGNMSAKFNGMNFNDLLSTGGETAFMSFMYQLGIQGAIFLALCVLSLKPKAEKTDKLKLSEIYLYFIPIIILGISFLQDNTFSPQCIVPYMLFLGGSSNIFEKKGD